MPEPAERTAIASAPMSVILPVHNAEADLEAVATAWVNCLNGLNRDYEILLVDDGSTDRSPALAAALAGRQPRVRVLTHPSPAGFGAALRTGLAAAQYPLLVYAACDPQYKVGEVKELLQSIDQADLVSGFRVRRPVPRGLAAVGRIYRWKVRLVFGVPLEPLPGWLGWSGHAYDLAIRLCFGVRVRDVNSAFKLFRRSIFERLPIQSNGPFVHAEILAKANFLECYLSEVAVSCRPDRTGKAGGLPAPLRELMAEGGRVFSRPDFGPPPAPPPEPSPTPANEAPPERPSETV